MCKKLAFLFVVLTLSSLTFAQQNQRQSAAGGAQLASETCAFTFTSGAGHGVTQYCVTANGNIAQFSAVGGNGLPQEFLNGVEPAIEGYGLCDVNSLTPYWDYAQTASNNWNTATAVATANSVKITRTTADGVWQLVQTITKIPGSKTAFGAAKIAMAITNLSTTDRLILFNRHANIDAGGTTFNDFDLTQTTVFGLVPFGNGNGLSSTASFVTTAFDFSLAFVMTVPGGPTPCQPFDNQGAQQAFFQGDGAVDQVFDLDILPGKTKTVTVTYKAI